MPVDDEQGKDLRAGEVRKDDPTKEHTFAAMLGPNGELAMGWCSPDEMDWSFLWDNTEHWDCDDHDIRKVAIRVRVPVLGKKPLIDAGQHVTAIDEQDGSDSPSGADPTPPTDGTTGQGGPGVGGEGATP